MISFDIDNSLVIIDNVSYKVNEQLMFTKDGQQFLVFSFPFSRRTHNTMWSVNDQMVMCYAFAPVESLKSWLEIVVALLPPIFVASGDIRQLSMHDAFWSLQNLISDFNTDSKTSNPEINNQYMNIINTLLKTIDIKTISEYLIESQPITFTMDINDNTLSQTVQNVIVVLYQFYSYHENLVKYHSLSCTADIICYILSTVLLLYTELDSSFLLTKDDLSVHLVLSLIIDLMIDRCGTELYINQRHEIAKMWVQQYQRKYPFIQNIKTNTQISKYAHQIKQLDTSNKLIYPYIISFNMSPSEHFNFRMQLLLDNISGNFLTIHELKHKLLEQITQKLINGLYPIHVFQNIITDEDGIMPKLMKFMSKVQTQQNTFYQ